PASARHRPGAPDHSARAPRETISWNYSSLVAAAAVAGVARAGARPGAVAHRLELLEAAAGADGDARERRLGEVRRHVRLLAQALVEPLQERPTAGEDDAAIHDVRRELGRRLVQRGLDCVDDLGDRILE